MKRIALLFMISAAFLAAISCVSQSPSTRTTSASNNTSTAPSFPDEKEYQGGGSSPSLLEAMQLAKAEAVKQGIVDIIGSTSEKANKAKLDEVIYSSKNVGGYATIKGTAKKDKSGDNYIYEATFVVKLKAIESTLKAHGIIEGGKQKTDAQAVVEKEKEADAVAEKDAEPLTDKDVYASLSKDEEAFIKKYVDKMSFLVYQVENTSEDEKYLKGGITLANDYLISVGKKTFDIAQVEKLKEDQALVHEETTGESLSLTQWIAQKLNADVYIELDAKSMGRTESGSKYYGTANVLMKAYESSTGDLVGSVGYNVLSSKAAFSKVSEDDARLQAVQSAVYVNVMPEIFKQINSNMVDSLKKHGIRYEVILQNPPGDRVMTKLWSKLKSKIRSYDSVSQSKAESKFSVYYIGSIDDLKAAFYDAVEAVPELESLEAVMSRGKSITFNSGL
jgi:hypothetical protein